MRIEFRRSGGMAGLTLVAVVDTATLAPGAAADLVAAVERADLDRWAALPTHSDGADRFQYHLSLQRGHDRSSFTIGESAVTPDLAPLLQALVAVARPARPATESE